MKRVLIFLCICVSTFSFGQNAVPGTGTKRILILLDGSGSMVDPWNGTTKWAVAKKLVSQTIDSIQKNNPGVEIGLRVFGHQSPKSEHDCKDSKLEVPIARNTSKQIKDALNRIHPQGYTPIAYSLFLAAGDFPDAEATNSIILITDGIENCEGDPCASSDVLRNKRITLKPFIIGIGLNAADKNNFSCVGSYYDASDEKSFKNAINVVISQALNNTTTQVNLIDAFGFPTETNLEMTFYDSFSGEIRYDLVHTLNAKGQPDTLYLNPVGKYNIVVHSTPEVMLKNVELTPGQHNIIGIDVPLGILQLTEGSGETFSEKQCAVRNRTTGEIIYVQNLNSSHDYIAGNYDLEILTLPEIIYPDFDIKGGVVNKIHVDQSGTLNISVSENTIYSIYSIKGDTLQKIYEETISSGPELIQLLPGDYEVISRSNIKKTSSATKETRVTIKSGKIFALKL